MTAGTDWHIYYAYNDSQPTTVEACTAVLVDIIGGPVTADIGELSGNPRDYYVRDVRLMRDARDGVQVVLLLSQEMRGPDDPETITRLTNVLFRGPMSATRTAIWDDLRAALEPLGYTNPSLTEMEVVLIDMAPEPARVRARASRPTAAKPRNIEVASKPANPYLDAVIAHPDDDAPRRAYAETLLAARDPRGEFIHLQCDLVRGGLPRDAAVRHRRRERDLLAAHGKTWIGRLFGLVTGYRFVRGFVDEVEVDAATWSSKSATILDAAPLLRSVRLGELLESTTPARGIAATSSLVLRRLRRALSSPSTKRLAGVALGFVGYGDRESQFDMYEMTSLGDRAIALLVAADLPHLRALSIEAPTEKGARLLATWPGLAHLERLSITGLDDPDEILAALDPSRVCSLALDDWHVQLARFTRLEELSIVESRRPVPTTPPRVSRLTYHRRADVPMTAEDVTAIASRASVVDLDLQAHHLPGWCALERVRLEQLRTLRVVSPEVTGEQARTLCRWPIAAQLEVLQVAGIDEPLCAVLSETSGLIVELARAL